MFKRRWPGAAQSEARQPSEAVVNPFWQGVATTKNVATSDGGIKASGRFDLKMGGLTLFPSWRACVMSLLNKDLAISVGMKCKALGQGLKRPTWVLSFALCGALGVSGGVAFAKTSALNPAQLGPFCPPQSTEVKRCHPL